MKMIKVSRRGLKYLTCEEMLETVQPGEEKVKGFSSMCIHIEGGEQRRWNQALVVASDKMKGNGHRKLQISVGKKTFHNV